MTGAQKNKVRGLVSDIILGFNADPEMEELLGVSIERRPPKRVRLGERELLVRSDEWQIISTVRTKDDGCEHTFLTRVDEDGEVTDNFEVQ